MATYHSAKVFEVNEVVVHTELEADAGIGATLLSVHDAAGFEENGGTFRIDETAEYTYESADLEENTIKLPAGFGLLVAYEADTRLVPLPEDIEKEATIQIDDQEDSDQVRVPQNLYDALPLGIRASGEEESIVVLSESDDEWIIHNIEGQPVVRDLGYAAPNTLDLPAQGAVDQPQVDQINTDIAAVQQVNTDQQVAIATAQAQADSASDLATTAQSTASGKNKVTYGPTASPSLTGRADGDLHFVRVGDTITQQQRVVSGAWVTETLTNAVIATLDAAKITTGILVADRIAANSISVAKLVIGGITENAILNPSFEDDLNGWATFGTTAGTVAIDTTDPVSGAKVVKITKTATTAAPGVRNSPFPIPVASGKWYLSVRAKAGAAVNSALTFRVIWMDVARATISVTNVVAGYSFTDTTWKLLEGTVLTPPAGTKYIGVDVFVPTAIAVGTEIYLDEFQARELVHSTRIEDNAITTGKLAADAVTAKHTITGPLFQTHAATGRGIKIVSSDNGAYGSLIAYDSLGVATLTLNGQTGAITMKGDLTSGSTISGATVTGGILQTNAAAARGIKITSSLNGGYGLLAVYDASGVATLSVNGQDGTIVMKGDLTTGSNITGAVITGGQFRTATSGQRLLINDDEEAGSIKGHTGDAAALSPTLINPKILGTGGARRQVLYMSSGALGGGVARVEVRSGSQDNVTWAPRIYLDAGDVEVSQRLIVRAGSTIEGSMDFTGANLNMTGASDPNLVYTRISTANGGLGTGDAGWNNSGALIRKASRREVKKNIRALTLEEALPVLDMEPVKFQWKKHLDMGEKYQAGFIAEQAAEVGADLWVQGETTPTGIHYAELTAALLLFVRDHRARLADIEERLDTWRPPLPTRT